MIEFHAPEYLRNVVRIITETGLRVYKELATMKKDQLDLENATVWIPDSKTPNGVAEVPLTPVATQAFRDQMRIAGSGWWLFPSEKNQSGHQRTFKTAWHKTLNRARKFHIFGFMIFARRMQPGSALVALRTSG